MEQEIEIGPEAGNYKFCAHCGDIFIAHHDLQQYCPEKNGRKDFCKYQHKKLVSESRLADKVIELSKAGVRLYEPNSLEKNENRLETIMGSDSQKIISSLLLDQVEYQVPYFTSKVLIAGTTKFLVTVGRFTIELIDKVGNLYTFKITRI
jgi:ribosomal protein S27AE